MSLCYESQKWMMITFAVVLVVMAIGVITMVEDVYGQNINSSSSIFGLPVTEVQDMINYCFDHASDSDNPVQDLVDKGLVNPQFNGTTCAEIKKDNDQYMEYLQKEEAQMREDALKRSQQMLADARNQSAQMLEDDGGVKYCSDFDEKNFKVQPGDPYNLDRDGDGIACED